MNEELTVTIDLHDVFGIGRKNDILDKVSLRHVFENGEDLVGL